jgi:pimeloyl-ACP methyl ester carboxylesterase
MFTNRKPSFRALVPAFAGVLGASVRFAAAAHASIPRADNAGSKPTVVLVHGAFADASGWGGVIERLQREGYPVVAPANPLRGVSSDAAYISSFLDTIGGPIILVGHSYGGAVITNAAVNHPNVKALVYIAAYIPDVGQAVAGLTPRPGSQSVLPNDKGIPPTVIVRPWYVLGVEGADGYIDHARFRQIFAADLPVDQATVLGLTQRGASLVALGEPSPAAAWNTIPAWALVAQQDNVIGTANVQAMAEHARAHIVKVRASHAVLISQPDDVVHRRSRRQLSVDRDPERTPR